MAWGRSAGSVVERGVDPAVLLDCLLDQRLHGCFVADVHLDREGLTTGIPDLIADGAARRFSARREDDGCAAGPDRSLTVVAPDLIRLARTALEVSD